jgi:hypothetical protein
MSGGGGNRQDNRQRGNAAQLLEKYKSLARDAQLAGDRVQTEYYLQFADHYFRVLSESRVRFEEQRRGRDEDDGDEAEDAELADAEAEADAEEGAERPQRRRGRDRDRDDRFERRGGRNNGEARDRGDDGEADERIAFEALPPAIGAESDSGDGDSVEEEKPQRRRARRPRADDGDSEVAPAA